MPHLFRKRSPPAAFRLQQLTADLLLQADFEGPPFIFDTASCRSTFLTQPRTDPYVQVTHTALILDAWRRSEPKGKGAEFVGKEASVPAAELTAPTASDRAGCAELIRLATTCTADAGRR